MNTEQSRPKPTEEELRRRRKAVDFARVKSELEGSYSHDPQYERLTELYCQGEIEWEDVANYVDNVIKRFANVA
jgi:hypothetical protein